MITEPQAIEAVLARLRVVLVETSHPGNIGAAARAMKTMGLTKLVLVKPNSYPSAEATARASGADDVLYHASVVDDLDAALQGCRLAFGISARRRGIASPEIDPRDCAATALAAVAMGSSSATVADYDINDDVKNDVALVFGRERSGLSNDELDRCQYLVRIPANPNYGSLNLAAAVQIIAYELRLRALQADTADTDNNDKLDKLETVPATNDEMERLYQHMQQTLLDIGFLNPANPRHLMRRLRRLFNRAQPEQREVNILRGLLTAAQRPKRRDGS